MVGKFEAKFPWIKWFGIASPYGELPAKLITMSAGGQPPDGSSIDNVRIQEMARRGLLEDLDPWIKSAGIDYMDDFIQARLEQQRVDGKLFALPVDLGSSAIYLNLPMFEEKGVDLPDPSWTYDDVIEISNKLTADKAGNNPSSSNFDENNIDTHGLAFARTGDWGLYRFYHLFHGYNGAEYFDKDFTKTRFKRTRGRRVVPVLPGHDPQAQGRYEALRLQRAPGGWHPAFLDRQDRHGRHVDRPERAPAP